MFRTNHKTMRLHQFLIQRIICKHETSNNKKSIKKRKKRKRKTQLQAKPRKIAFELHLVKLFGLLKIDFYSFYYLLQWDSITKVSYSYAVSKKYKRGRELRLQSKQEQQEFEYVAHAVEERMEQLTSNEELAFDRGR